MLLYNYFHNLKGIESVNLCQEYAEAVSLRDTLQCHVPL